MTDDESSCYYHPGKSAEVVCDGCGRFLCSLCNIDFEGRHFCPACLENTSRTGETGRFRTQHVYYDSIALAVAVVPLLIFYLALLTAPVAIYLALRHWRTPFSALPWRRWCFVAALCFAFVELADWGAGFMYIFSAWK